MVVAQDNTRQAVQRAARPATRSRQLGIETESVVAGAIGAVVCGTIACVLLLGTFAPVWDVSGSVGLIAGCSSLVVGVAAGYTAYWRSRRGPGQEWRLKIAA